MAHLIDREREGKKDVQFSHLCNIEKERGVKDILKHRDSGSAVVTCEKHKLVGIYMGMSLVDESETKSQAESEEFDERIRS